MAQIRNDSSGLGDPLPAGPQPTKTVGRVELYGTVFCTGAAVMVVEILGTRVIGPVFGVNLFVWTALLTVTLGSLAVGYYAGGALVDRTPQRRLLGVLVAASGALLGLIPLVRRPILLWAESLGPRGGALVSASLLFAPTLAALGSAAPIAIRLLTDDYRFTGHRVGSVYAISTAGSLIGTLLTGFVLVPAFDIDRILMGTAVLLVLVGAIPLALRRQPAAIVAAIVPLLSFSLSLGAGPATMPPGITVIEHAQSLYGRLEVIEDVNRGVRLLRADHSIIGGQFTRDRSPSFAFIHILESVRFLRPGAKDMLQLGLGVGSLPMALKAAGIHTDVVEIDAQVVRLARQHFGFSSTGDVVTEDARTFLQRTGRTYDIVVHDTFIGGTTPEHLLSREVMQRARSVLRSGGVLALTFPGYTTGARAESTFAVKRTLRAVFPIVRVFQDGPPAAENRLRNLVFFASDSQMDFTIPANATFGSDTSRRILDNLRHWETLQDVPPGPVITDAWNSLARLQLPSAEEHFEAMDQLLPKEVWIQ
jgi:hypothetical protein